MNPLLPQTSIGTAPLWLMRGRKAQEHEVPVQSASGMIDWG